MKMILFFLLFSTSSTFAQYENVWAFGKGAGLDFNNGKPIPIQTNINGFGEANASVCNSEGKLLFYTDGSLVWDRKGNIMPNGNELTPIISSNNNLTPTASSSQGALIMPMPGSALKYYIFSIISNEMPSAGNLYYSVVDMELNNGLGDVTIGQKGVLLDRNVTEEMTAVVGNQCNAWLLVRSRSDNTFKAYEVSTLGISTTPILSNAGIYYGSSVGEMKFSFDRTKLVVCNGNNFGNLQVLDFDITNGILSNVIVLDYNSYYGVAFSPDDSKIYGRSGSNIYQFDLNANNPGATKALIGSSSFTHLKVGPDGKIYFITKPSHPAQLGVINYPNVAGVSCGYDPNAVQLLPDVTCWGGLPNVVPVVIYNMEAPVSNFIQAACWSTSLSLQPSAEGWNFLWNDSNISSVSTVNVSGVYWVNYFTSPCTYRTDTFHVNFPNGMLPRVNIGGSCANQANGKAYAHTYVGDTVTYHYTWFNASQDTLSVTDTLREVPSGDYSLRITTVQCDTTLSLFIPREDRMVSFRADSIVCVNEEVTFQNTSDPYFTQFSWSFGDENFSLLFNPVHTYEIPDNYTVMLTGSGERCSDTAYRTFIADPRMPGIFHSYPERICVGEAIAFSTDTGTSTLSRHWQFGDGTEMTASNESTLQHAYEVPGVLLVTLNSRFRACPDTTFTDTVYVYALPKVDLGPDTFLCGSGAPIYLFNLETNIPWALYSWNTGDTTKMLRVVQPGDYSLTISGPVPGCTATGSIVVKKGCYISVPNAFTPNGDGVNDFFFPRQLLSKGNTEFRMQIINRLGQVMFETSQIQGSGWDGRYNGIEQPGGAYVYRVDVVLDGLEREYYMGSVILLR